MLKNERSFLVRQTIVEGVQVFSFWLDSTFLISMIYFNFSTLYLHSNGKESITICWFWKQLMPIYFTFTIIAPWLVFCFYKLLCLLINQVNFRTFRNLSNFIVQPRSQWMQRALKLSIQSNVGIGHCIYSRLVILSISLLTQLIFTNGCWEISHKSLTVWPCLGTRNTQRP
jgi:hypothetical protein